MSQEVLGILPRGWVWTSLEECCSIVQGQSPPGDTYNPDGIGLPFLQGKAEFGSLFPTPVKWCSQPRKIAEPGDVLVSIRAPVGPSNLCTQRSCIGRGLAAVRALEELPSRYVLYWIRASETLLRANATGTTFEAIRGDNLRDHPIPLAPMAEQRRIVAEIEKQFTRLDAAVEALKRTQANLKRYRASVLKAACEGRLVPTEAALARAEGREYEHAAALLERIRTSPNPLRKRRGLRTPLSAGGLSTPLSAGGEGPGVRSQQPLPDTSSLPPLPEGWVWTTLGQISQIQGGIQKQPKRAPRSNAFPFLRVANVFRGRLDLGEIHSIELFEGELDKLRLESGDLLIVEGNGSVSEIGRMAIWDGSIPNCVHQNHIIRARILGGMFQQFASAYWNSPEGTARVMGVAASTSGLYTLSVSKVSVLPIPLPPLAEQRRIVAEVERRLSVIQAAETGVSVNLKRAERLRQAVLKRAFEGKLVPQDPSDEPASVLLERIRAERDTSPNPLRKRRGLLNPPLRLRRGAGGEV